ncbi:CBS domain-containing protein [Actinomadura gamaensis]|uniref:CBS domain-containing protein n=1 Tax=Actinomadura gamaensis TaxID=1763541 RepID=A0ABV9TTM8_9ACTN
MTTDVVAANPATTFRELVERLEGHRIGGMPVIDEDGHVLGVVSETDLLPREAAGTPPGGAADGPGGRGRRLAQARERGGTAAEVMSSPALTVTPGTSAVEAARLLARHRVNRLPVVDAEGVIAGVVSRADLLRVFLKPDEQIRTEVLDEVVARSLWQDPAHVTVEVRNGVVTLRGRLDLASLVPLAEELTRSVQGVTDVRNELTYVRDDVHERINPQALRFPR